MQPLGLVIVRHFFCLNRSRSTRLGLDGHWTPLFSPEQAGGEYRKCQDQRFHFNASKAPWNCRAVSVGALDFVDGRRHWRRWRLA
jgi:hypothetical protein